MEEAGSSATGGSFTSNPTGSTREVSFVWTYYNRLTDPDASGKYKTECKICRQKNIAKTYEMTVGGGYGSMTRHLKKEHDITKESHTIQAGAGSSRGGTQTQLGGYMFQQPGGGMPFSYNRDRMIENMCTYVNLEELPFSYAESYNLENFNRMSLQPAFSRIPRNTLKRRTMKQYNAARKELIEQLGVFDGRVCLTSDTWSSKQGEPYLCITVHWIDNDFLLQKRIIAFDVMEERHSGYNIFTRIRNTCLEFNVAEKIFTISFDNATANTKCIDYVKSEMQLLLGGQLVHVRCCAHVINLSAQEGIVIISPLLKPIRQVVKWIRQSHGTRNRYGQLCRQSGLRRKKFGLDTPTRWNSTYELLVDAIKYKDIITTLYNEAHVSDPDAIPLSEESWSLATIICDLLKAYKHASDAFSYVYEPNVHLVIMHCVCIVLAMVTCEETQPCMQMVVADMKAKWLDYFTTFPSIYGIACILDPGVKTQGLKNLLDYYYDSLNIKFDVQKYVDGCVALLHQLYETYDNDSAPGPSSSTAMPKSRRFDNKLASILFRRPSSGSSSTSSANPTTVHSIDEYLAVSHETDSEDFHLLMWWKAHSAQYPILSKIARDVLVVPASTVASESAFSAGRRVLDEKRSSLHPDSVKMCVCKKDWDQATIRRQGLKEDNEFEEDPYMTTDDSSAAGTDLGDRDNDDDE